MMAWRGMPNNDPSPHAHARKQVRMLAEMLTLTYKYSAEHGKIHMRTLTTTAKH